MTKDQAKRFKKVIRPLINEVKRELKETSMTSELLDDLALNFSSIATKAAFMQNAMKKGPKLQNIEEGIRTIEGYIADIKKLLKST